MFMNDLLTLQLFAYYDITNEDALVRPTVSYDLADGFQSYDFPVDIVSKTLRFDAVESSGGNTGFVELAAYAAESSSE